MTALALEAVPRLKPGVRRRYDAARGQNILLAPERVLVLDDIANAVLETLNGATTIEALCAALADAIRDRRGDCARRCAGAAHRSARQGDDYRMTALRRRWRCWPS